MRSAWSTYIHVIREWFGPWAIDIAELKISVVQSFDGSSDFMECPPGRLELHQRYPEMQLERFNVLGKSTELGQMKSISLQKLHSSLLMPVAYIHLTAATTTK